MKPGRMQSHHNMGDRALGRQDRVMEEEEEEEEDARYDVYVRRAGSRRGNYEMAQQRSLSMDFWKEKKRQGWHGKYYSKNFLVSATIWENAHLQERGRGEETFKEPFHCREDVSQLYLSADNAM